MRYLTSIFSLLIFGCSFGQIAIDEGAVKFGFIQNGEYVFLKEPVAVKFINQQNNEVVLDTIYLESKNAIPPKILKSGIYKIELYLKNYPSILVTDIIVLNGKISFIERFDLDSLMKREETLKVKYQKPKTGYKSCG
jgi:hypothetical protein